MTCPGRRLIVAVLWVFLVVGCGRAGSEPSWLEPAREIAPGVTFYKSADVTLVQGTGPIAVFLLRIDTKRVRLSSVLSNDEVADAETVSAIATRHRAIAGINGGFFNGVNGEPTGVLKVSGELVSDASTVRGAVIIHSPPDRSTSLTFDRLSVKVTLRFNSEGQAWTVPIDGVDTTRERRKVMLYTPAYHADTDTAPTGTEWVLSGDPLQVTAIRVGAGRTPIPPSGAVLSYGGLALPDPLAALAVGTTVTLERSWRTLRGLPVAELEAADHVVNGAGLLRWNGHVIDDWSEEGLTPDVFTEAFHPRTMIGLDRDGFVWLAAVDGRQPEYSIGMRFSDLQRLADRLELSDALNLDGGGSTTMVVKGQVVNRPSDPAGMRAVGDAILVLPQ